MMLEVEARRFIRAHSQMALLLSELECPELEWDFLSCGERSCLGPRLILGHLANTNSYSGNIPFSNIIMLETSQERNTV